MALRYEITESVSAVALVATAGGVLVPGASATATIKDLSGNNLTVYAAETGVTTATNPITTDAFGRIEGWVEAPDYDIVVTGVTSYTQKVRQSPARDFNIKSYGAVGSGDDSTAVYNTVVAANAAGGGRVVVPPGTYRIDTYKGSAPTAGGGNPRSLLYFSGFANVTIYISPGAVLQTTLNTDATTATLIEFRDGTNCPVGGPGKLTGPNHATQDSTNANVRPAAVRMTNCPNSDVTDVEITGFGYAGVYLTGGTKYSEVAGTYIHDQQGHGIIEDDFPGSGVYVSTPPAGNDIHDNTITNLTTGTGTGAFGIGIDSPGSRTWTKVHDNHIDTVSLAGIKCNVANAKVAHNDILNAAWSGILYQGTLAGAGPTFHKNQIYNCGLTLRGDISDYSPGIWLEADASHAATVGCTDNKVINSGKHGIYAFGLPDSTIEQNEIVTTNNSGHGIYLVFDTAARDDASYCNNKVRLTAGDGIRITTTGAGVGSITGLNIDGNKLRSIGLTAINFLSLALNQFVAVSCANNTLRNYALNGTGDGINFDVTRGTMDNNTIESGTAAGLRNYVRTSVGLASRIYWRGRFPSGNSSGGGFNDQSGQLKNMLDDANGVAFGVASSNGAGSVVHAIDAGGGSIRAGKSLINARVTQTLAANGAVTFDASAGNLHDVTLQANATSSTVGFGSGSSGNFVGMEITLNWRQDGTGSRTYAWPANCKFAAATAPTATTTANRVDAVTFRFDGTNWLEISRAVAVG